ncbi:glycosyltransferase family 39 protein [Patescibacteria group bacterium]|nr:glycosyltransferase family 39 protein [Patescibacteria group bacterium]
MTKSSEKIISIISLFTLLYLGCLVIDLTPFIRGPIDNILASRWPYYFVNTLSKIWEPGLIVALFFLIFNSVFDRKLNRKRELLFLSTLVLIIFLFQISLVYFSRFGVNILFRRLVDPGINGYYTTAIRENDNAYYLRDFSKNILQFNQHARGHPPGSLFLIRGVNYFFENNIDITKAIYSKIPPPSKDSIGLWEPLNVSQRVSAVILPFLLHFLAAISIVPFYFLAKNLFNQKIAIRTVFLYSIIPSLSFFALLFDPFYTIFSLISFTFLVQYLKSKKRVFAILSGSILGAGLFFSMSIIPYLGFFIFYVLFSSPKEMLKTFTYWSFGFLLLFLLPFILFGYDPIVSLQSVVKYQLPREYLPWLIFNPYDFFIYMGFSISLLFFYVSYKILRKDNLTKAFWILFILLVISGISRGEVGRIWLPLMSLPILIVSQFLTNNFNLNKKYFSILLFLLILQVVIMEEFWVPIW